MVEAVAREANNLLANYPGAPVFIMGDYNNCRLVLLCSAFISAVRGYSNKKGKHTGSILWNITNAFCARSYPSLHADHNVICLLPAHRQELKLSKPQLYTTPQWTEDAITHLQGSLACTN